MAHSSPLCCCLLLRFPPPSILCHRRIIHHHPFVSLFPSLHPLFRCRLFSSRNLFPVGLVPFPLSILDIDFLSTSSFNLCRTSHLASFLIPLKPWIFALIAIRPRSRTRTPGLDSYCPWPAKTAPSAPSTFSKSSSRYVTPNHHIAFSQSKRKEFDHCRAISNPHHSLLYTPYFISPRTKTALYICTPICPCGHCQHHTQSLCTQLPQLAESLVRLILGLTPVSMLFLTSAHAGISLLSRLSRH